MAFILALSLPDRNVYTCLSTDIKPTTGKTPSDVCYELDTGDKYEFNGANWAKTSTTTASGESAGLFVPMGGELNTYHDGATTNATSASFGVSANPSWQAFITGTSGALSATVTIQVTNDNIHWTDVGTMPLSVASWSSAADDDVSELIPDKFNSWLNTRAVISDITGTGAAVSVIGG